MHHDFLEGGAFRVGSVDMQGVVVARQLNEAEYVSLSNSLDYGALVAQPDRFEV